MHLKPDSSRLRQPSFAAVAVPTVGILALLGCSPSEAPSAAGPAPSSVQAPVAKPATAERSAANPALPADLAARLVRPHSPVLGPAEAPVTIVEFLDPACEACRAFSSVVEQVRFLYPGDVRVVVRFAAFHTGSDEAIRLLEAARQQGKFETILHALFEGQPDWASHHAPDVERAWQIAAAAGLDVPRARRDARSPPADELLRMDGEDVVALKVARTPTFYVNGRLLEPFGAEQLMQLVAAEAQAVKASP